MGRLQFGRRSSPWPRGGPRPSRRCTPSDWTSVIGDRTVLGLHRRPPDRHRRPRREPAYAIAALVIVTEEHHDEFPAVAEYLNDLAETDPKRGITAWLGEVHAVRVDDSS